jgi:hypothetical protein
MKDAPALPFTALTVRDTREFPEGALVLTSKKIAILLSSLYIF